ncbi:MAG: sugar porter family MFS transporter [Porticoccaceae bacterium]
MTTAVISVKPQLSVIQITLIVALGGLLMGYDAATVATSQMYFTQYFDFTPAQQGWVISSAGYGCFLGAISAGYLTTAYSRKYTLILSAVLYIISAVGSGIADSLTVLVSYRIILGLSIGMIAMTSPMYIAEISPSNIRGKMVSYHQLAMVVGFILPFLVGFLISSVDSSHSTRVSFGWRLMFWFEIVPALPFLFLLFFIPHSPRWLMLKHRNQQAQKVLNQLIDDKGSAQSEYKLIAQSLAEVRVPARKLLFRKGLGFALFLGVMLAIFQQATGIVAILIYSGEIFSQALGYDPQQALIPQLWVSLVNLVFTFVAIYTVDSWGRKPLLVVGVLGMLLGLLALALSVYMQQMGLVSLIGVLLFVGAYAMSMGPVVWVILAEIFPNNVRSLAMSIAIGAQCLTSALVTNGFPILHKSHLNAINFNGALPYFLFASVCIITILFVWKLVPETKGKTLEEMEQLWR